MLAVSAADGTPRVWAAPRHGAAQTWSGPRCSNKVAVDPQGRWLACAVFGGQLTVHEITSRRLAWRREEAVEGLAFSGDGRLLATTTLGGSLTVMAAATGRTVMAARLGSARTTWRVAFSADGSLVYTDDGTWLVASGQALDAANHGLRRLVDGRWFYAGEASAPQLYECISCGSMAELLAHAQVRLARREGWARQPGGQGRSARGAVPGVVDTTSSD